MLVETYRLYLRPLKEQDAPVMSGYRNKEEVAKYQSWDHYSLNDAVNRIQHCQRITIYNQPKTDYHLAIVSKQSKQMIGDIFVEVVNRKVFVLGYTLDSDFWSLGYGSEIVGAFIDYMKVTYDMKKVICYVYKDNEKSIHLLNKLGFHKFEESYFYDDVGYIKKL